MNNNELRNYKKEYSDSKLMSKLTGNFRKMGVKLVYMCFIMYHLLKDNRVPAKLKATIIGALGYVIAPLDLVADITPVAGFSDDIAMVIAAFGLIVLYVNDDIKAAARESQRLLHLVLIEHFKIIKRKLILSLLYVYKNINNIGVE